MGRTPISEPCLFCLKLGLIPNLYMIFGITIPKIYINFGIRIFFLIFVPKLKQRTLLIMERG